jgi:hypothetical protein
MNVAHPTRSDKEALARVNSRTFTVMHRDWHMTVARLALSDVVWQQDPTGYLATVSRLVQQANAAGLFVVLNLHEDNRAGIPPDNPAIHLPTPLASVFWRAVAATFQATPGVLFDVFNEPTVSVAEARNGKRGPVAKGPLGLNATDWQLWLRGGVVAGHTYVGMQDLVDAIRSAGAQQVVVVEGLQAAHSFAGMGTNTVNDPDVMYSVHPYFARYQTRSAWDAAFGFLANRYPLFAGEWGLIPNGYNTANCAHVQPAGAQTLVTDLLRYFQERRMSWSVFAFMAPKLIQNYQQYTPTTLSVPWRCGDRSNSKVGIGEIIKSYLTAVG